MAGPKDYIIATRPWSLSMTFISITVGTLLAWQDGPVGWGWYALTLIGMILFHSGVNVLNDYFDTRYRVDQPDSPTARYRPHPIFSGLLTPKQLLLEGVFLLAATIIIGLALAWFRSPKVFWVGLGGFLAGVFYTAGPVRYKYRALGELSVALMWGPGMVEGAYLVQRGILSWRALWISVPFGVLVALVIFANNFRDISYDTRRRVKTLSILLGPKMSMAVYVGFIGAAYLAIGAMVVFGILSPWGLLVLLSLPKAASLVRTFLRGVPEAADAMTAQLNTVFGILLMAVLLSEKLV
jgi:1,4-dihydroxy-2-naphthoate octaprenyltransferase